MAVILNKQLHVLNDDNVYVPIYTVRDEVFLTADIIRNAFSYSQYKRAITSPLSERVIRIYLLNDDETIREDISEDIKTYNIDMTFQQGQTRSANITLMNYTGKWNPSPVKGYLWKGVKFRIDIGLYYNERTYWKKCGIYTPADPQIDDDSQTISIQLYDKFALLDNTLCGNHASSLNIPVNTRVQTAIKKCLLDDRGDGKPYDKNPIIFPSKYSNITTPYTINKTPNVTTGEIIIELANMIFCDVYYNDDGQLTLSSGEDDLTVDIESFPIQWEYQEDELSYSNSSFSIDYTKVINRVVVYGAIDNGKQFKGVATNTNPYSPTNINFTLVNEELIEDSNIIGDDNCLNRAKYELSKKTKLGIQVKFNSIFIPHLLPNDLVTWTNSKYGIKNEIFTITSIHIDENSLMNISLSNLKEVAF